MRKRLFPLMVVVALAVTPLAALPVGAAQVADDDPPSYEFLTGPNEGEPDDIALGYMRREAASLELSAADVAELAVRSSYTSRHNGVTHVNINQRFEGLEVFGADTTVNIAEDGSVIHVGGAAVSGLEAGFRAMAGPDLDPVDAVEAAADALELAEPVGLEQLPVIQTADVHAVVSDGGISEEPIPAKLGWHHTGEGLRLAWQLVIQDNSDVHVWNATVDAESGDLLAVEDWVSDNNLDDLAERLGRGGASSATATATSSSAPIVTPNPVDDGSSYRVFPLPLESPNDGGRSLITNPADAFASPYGWHDVSATPEPDYTITRGNNTNTYTDWNNSNSPNNTVLHVVVDEPSSAAGEYSAVAASFGPPVEDGLHGAIVLGDDGSSNPTYACQPLVDFPAGAIALVDRGDCPFVDKVNNAQDAGAIGVIVGNNVSGNPIAMGGSDPSITIPSVMVSLANANTVKAGLPATGGFSVQEFPSQPEGGESLTFDFPLDLSQHPHEYWEAATTNLFYWCNVAHDVFWHYGFDEASGNFQQNNYGRGGVGGDAVDCEAQDGGGMNNANFFTPAADGGTPRMQMYLWNVGPAPERDGDLEAGIILHEYSHGVSNRLTGGPGINCLSGDQRMGEGWSDYHGIVTLIDPELDDPQGPRGMGTYALWQDEPPRQGAGIRPRPYSRDMFIQPFTYESIGSGAWLNGGTLAAPHHIGHGWLAILWDMTWDLIDKHGFNPDVYGDWSTGGNNLSQQLVMDGLKLQGCAPNFIDGRDAIIAAETVLTGGEDYCTLWASFARRGLGFSATSEVNGQSSNSRNAASEAFDTPPECRRDFRPPVNAAYGDLNTIDAGDTVPLRFDAGRNRGDIIVRTGTFSRQVDCSTLEVVSEGEHVTPRARPIPLDSVGQDGSRPNPQGTYQLNWATDEDWSGTCREVVVTLDDGIQHRAFYQFD